MVGGSMRKKKTSLFDICNYAFMALVLFITIYPLYYTVIASVSEPSAVASGEVLWKPIEFTLDAYQRIIAYAQLWRGYANTIFYTVFGTIFNILLTIPAAYVMSKKYLPYRKGIMTYLLITMYFGGGMIPTYLLVKNLGLLNTRTVLVIMGGVSIYNLIVAKSYFSTSISESLYEAAEIDGAGELRKFLTIAIPLSKPIIAVMVLYYAVGHWNSYFDALLYVTDRSLEPLQSVLRKILIQNQEINIDVSGSANVDQIKSEMERAYAAYTMKYAMVFIASAPLLAAYPFVQKYFVKGVMVGAVKE